MYGLFLDLYQPQHNFGPDLDPNRLILMVFSKEYFDKDDFEKKSADHKKACKIM